MLAEERFDRARDPGAAVDPDPPTDFELLLDTQVPGAITSSARRDASRYSGIYAHLPRTPKQAR